MPPETNSLPGTINAATESSPRVNVLIAGAGPVGLTLATELARFGITVRIVDQAEARTDKSKALVLWSRSLELLDQAGFVEPFIASGLKAHGAQLSTGKEIIAKITLDGLKSRFPYALMIPQSETERVLEERLAQYGLQVGRRTSLESFDDTGSSVQAVLCHADGSKEKIEADWLVGCDGAHSTVRHGLGLPFEGSTQPSDWYLADGHFSGLDGEDLIHIFWHRDGILAFFPIVHGRWRVIADLGPASDSKRHADPTLTDIQSLLDQRSGRNIRIEDAFWLAAFRINERKVAQYAKGRVFLAGDAAHIHSPAGGQGMNTGMQDAFNLAWKIALVIRGGAGRFLLDSYSTERSAVGDMVLRNAGHMTDAAVMRNPIAQGLRNAVVRFAMGFPQITAKAANSLSETAISYDESPLSITAHPHGKITAGMRWPDKLPFDAGSPRLIAMGPEAVTAALASRFPDLVQSGPADDSLLLIRPDGYVGFVGAPSDEAKAGHYLEMLATHS
jgi:2-polyprenyl-6-methoxyphenol hydroxylase-like FAD-dependent oxidoreductase